MVNAFYSEKDENICHFVQSFLASVFLSFVQVAQTFALTDREQEEIRILELENTVQLVQHDLYSKVYLNDLVM